MGQKHSKDIDGLNAKLREVGWAATWIVESGYWVVTIWKKDKDGIDARAAGLTPKSALLAATLEVIRKHL